MRRLLCFLLTLFSLSAFAQYPEVDAAVEALMAKDLPALAKHLPPGLQKGLADLPANEQLELADEMLPSQMFRKEGMEAKRFDTPDALVVIKPLDPNVRHVVTVTIALDKRISDGSECLLRFNMVEDEGQVEQFHVWLRFVDREWRIYELQVPGKRSKVNLDAPDFLARMRHTEANSNEASAVGSLRSYNTAAVTYASSYPDIGFPQTAEEFGVSRYGTGVDEHHAGLLDSTLTTPPFQRKGYRFTYKRASESEYTVIARPIKFGVTGNRSFFTDQSGVIRSTEKEEEPTANDEPLQ